MAFYMHPKLLLMDAHAAALLTRAGYEPTMERHLFTVEYNVKEQLFLSRTAVPLPTGYAS